MLVLSRKLGERVLVPQCGLSITVVAVEGNLIRLGFTAPSEGPAGIARPAVAISRPSRRVDRRRRPSPARRRERAGLWVGGPLGAPPQDRRRRVVPRSPLAPTGR